jgi:DNA-binding CsgD family transcriptional regulator
VRSPKAAVLGRDVECEAVSVFLDDLNALPGALVIEGEAGIGKSTVWNAGVAEARESGYRVLECRTAGSEVQLSYAALADLFEPALNETAAELRAPQLTALRVAFLLDETEGPPPEQRAIGFAVLGVVRALAARAPVLVAVDDVQWLDSASAAALDFALRRLRGEPLALLATLRAATTNLLPAATAEARRVSLGPLSLGALHGVVHARVGVSLPRPALRRLAGITGGNPFYALEIARAFAQRGEAPAPHGDLPMPGSLREVVDERLRALPADTRHALLVVAALGDARSATVAHAVPRASLELALSKGVLQLDGDRIRFSHPLLASGVYAAAPPSARAKVHRALATIVDDVEQRAHHLALGSEQPDGDVAEALATGAAGAQRRGAPAAAAELWELADQFTPPERRDGSALLAAAECYLTAGDLERARRLLGRLLEASPAGPRRAEVLIRLAWVVASSGDQRTAENLFDEALSEVEEDLALAARAEEGLAWMTHMLGDLERAQAHARAALGHAERSGDPEPRTEALADLGFVDVLRGDENGVLLLRSAVELERRAGRRWRHIESHPSWLLALALEYTDGLREAKSELDALRQELSDTGDETALAFVESHLCRVAVLTGDWADARVHADACHDLSLQTGHESELVFALSNLVLLAAHTGEVQAARSRADEGLRLAERAGLLPGRIELLGSLGLAELSLGDFAAAESPLSAATADARASGFREPRVFRLHANAIEALVGLGRVAEAEPLLAELEAATGPWPAAVAARCRGLLLADEGDFDGALVELEAGLVLAEGLGMPFERARTLLVAGMTRRRARQKRAARDALGEASAEFERLGAAAWCIRAGAESERIGGRPPRTGELTPTEKRVAALVARGLANKEIAAELYLTVRTVETHLSRIYAKLHIRSRAQLARRFAEDGTRR